MLKLYTQGTFQSRKRVVICRGQGTYFVSPYFNLKTTAKGIFEWWTATRGALFAFLGIGFAQFSGNLSLQE